MTLAEEAAISRQMGKNKYGALFSKENQADNGMYHIPKHALGKFHLSQSIFEWVTDSSVQSGRPLISWHVVQIFRRTTVVLPVFSDWV